jgi:uncharacterized protein YjbJ (UPF0337 family)
MSRRVVMDNKDQVKGKVKQAVGDLTDDKALKREGKADEAAGDVKGCVESIKHKADDLIDAVKSKILRR